MTANLNTGGGCTTDTNNSGNYVCTLNAQFPPGSDTVSLTTYDGLNATGNVLSEGTATVTITAGTANALSLTLDANVGGATIGAPSNAFVDGSVDTGFSVVGAAPQSFTLSLTDPSGAKIVEPGLPVANVTSGDSTFTVSTQSGGFTLHAVDFATSSARISISATPPPGSALSAYSKQFNVTQTPLIAVAFYPEGSAGEVDLYTPGSDTSLVAFGNTIDSGLNSPHDVAFDGSGNLFLEDDQRPLLKYTPSDQADTVPMPSATGVGNLLAAATTSTTVAAL